MNIGVHKHPELQRVSIKSSGWREALVYVLILVAISAATLLAWRSEAFAGFF